MRLYQDLQMKGEKLTDKYIFKGILQFESKNNLSRWRFDSVRRSSSRNPCRSQIRERTHITLSLLEPFQTPSSPLLSRVIIWLTPPLMITLYLDNPCSSNTVIPVRNQDFDNLHALTPHVYLKQLPPVSSQIFLINWTLGGLGLHIWT